MGVLRRRDRLKFTFEVSVTKRTTAYVGKPLCTESQRDAAA
jgi:hypothetical protein